MRFHPYPSLESANVIVDGAPQADTVLTLSHWPKSGSPREFAADTSAEIVFRWLSAGRPGARGAELVSNNHFDEDGLVGIYAAVDPERAMARRELLSDVARAGDFG